MDTWSSLVIAILGGGLLLALVFLIRRKSPPTTQDVLAREGTIENELRKQLAQRETELGQVRLELNQTSKQNGELSAQIKFLNEALVKERHQIDALQQRFHQEFEAVCNKLLLANTTNFAKESTESLKTLLQPFKDELKDFKGKLDVTQVETAKHSALLQNEIGRIGTEAANLSKALKGDVKVLGNWGENMLDRILEKSGLQEGLHYRRQQSGIGEGGHRRRLDVIVDLPDSKHLVIDSKVSLTSYEQHSNATDDPLRIKHLSDHLDCLRAHIRSLSSKRYHEIYGITAPEFVLMYVPIEAAFFVAVAEDPALFSEALEKNVVLTTNSTLLATLRTAASVWRVADQQRHAIEIARRGGQLYDKFVGFIEDLEDVGKALKKSREAWEGATAKLHTGTGNLLRQVEQLRELGVKASKALPPEIKAKIEEYATSTASAPSLSNTPDLVPDITQLSEPKDPLETIGVPP